MLYSESLHKRSYYFPAFGIAKDLLVGVAHGRTDAERLVRMLYEGGNKLSPYISRYLMSPSRASGGRWKLNSAPKLPLFEAVCSGSYLDIYTWTFRLIARANSLNPPLPLLHLHLLLEKEVNAVIITIICGRLSRLSRHDIISVNSCVGFIKFCVLITHRTHISRNLTDDTSSGSRVYKNLD